MRHMLSSSMQVIQRKGSLLVHTRQIARLHGLFLDGHAAA